MMIHLADPPRTDFKLLTDALDANGLFDPRYTSDSDNSSPELRWESPPEGTASFALLMEDLDAGGGEFTHWLVYRIPPTILHLPTGIPAQESLPNGIRQGINSLGKLGYAGPCPPVGSPPHRYRFRLYALREMPELASRLPRAQVGVALNGLILATAELTGRYRRLAQPQQRAS